jgi:hypothetical protein
MAVDRLEGWPSESKGRGDKERQFGRSGAQHPHCNKVPPGLTTEKQGQRIQQALRRWNNAM